MYETFPQSAPIHITLIYNRCALIFLSASGRPKAFAVLVTASSRRSRKDDKIHCQSGSFCSLEVSLAQGFLGLGGSIGGSQFGGP